MKDFLGIIPARYASTRFPGKPLADIGGKTMIQRVYEKASEAIPDVVVATDDNRILDHVKEFGGQAVFTSESHQSGTDRCFEALNAYQDLSGDSFDIVINIQGDEPFIRTDQIEFLKGCFKKVGVQIATLIKQIENPNVILDPNRPKVVVNKLGEALYFSRSPIPYVRGEGVEKWINTITFYQHIGLYAYKSEILKEITSLEKGSLEAAESLEQLRWIENGYKIQTAVTEFGSFGIDTPEDLERALGGNLI